MGSSTLKFEFLGDLGKLVYRGRAGKTSVDFSGEDVSLSINDNEVLKATKDKVFIPHIKTNVISDLGEGVQIGDVHLGEGITLSGGIVEKVATFRIGPEDIAGTHEGSIGHPDGAMLLESPGENYILELISAVLYYDHDGLCYIDGDDDLKIKQGDSEISGPTATEDLLGACSKKALLVTPMASFGAPLVIGKGLSLCGTPFRNPLNATGDLTGYISYRLMRID